MRYNRNFHVICFVLANFNLKEKRWDSVLANAIDREYFEEWVARILEKRRNSNEQRIVAAPIPNDDVDEDVFHEINLDSENDEVNNKSGHSFISSRTKKQLHWMESMEVGYCFVS